MAACFPILKAKTFSTGNMKVIALLEQKRLGENYRSQSAVPDSQEAKPVSKWASKKPAEMSTFYLNTFLHLSHMVSILNNKATKSSCILIFLVNISCHLLHTTRSYT